MEIQEDQQEVKPTVGNCRGDETAGLGVFSDRALA